MRWLIPASALTTACAQLLEVPDVERGACAPDAELVAVAPVPGITGPLGVQSAQLSRDERTIVFSRLTTAGSDDADRCQATATRCTSIGATRCMAITSL